MITWRPAHKRRTTNREFGANGAADYSLDYMHDNLGGGSILCATKIIAKYGTQRHLKQSGQDAQHQAAALAFSAASPLC